MRSLEENFSSESLEHWQTCQKNNGCLTVRDGTLDLAIRPHQINQYTNAQIDDYQHLKRKHFHWRAPLKMQLDAKFSHGQESLIGTSGFGFWNDPFMMTGWRTPSLPKALWFFHACRSSNMQVAQGVPGHGFKAATIDAWRFPFISLIPTIPLSLPLMLNQKMREKFWPIAQSAMACQETILDVSMDQWHHYEIHWQEDSVQFYVDEAKVCDYKVRIKGPLGLVIWMDNQAMTVTPWGKCSHSVVTCSKEQRLQIRELKVQMP